MTLKEDAPDPTECDHGFAHIGPVGIGPVGLACITCGWLEKWGDAKEWENNV